MKDGYIKLRPEVKEKWLAALRSGDYLQGQGKLVVGDPRDRSVGADGSIFEPQFCCLGVLYDVMEGADAWAEDQGDQGNGDFGIRFETEDDFDGETIYEVETGQLTSEFRHKYVLDSYAETELMKLNDGTPDCDGKPGSDGLSFEEIADWIEEKL